MSYNYKPPEVKESEFTPVAPGTYTARCVKIVDLGTQELLFEGEKLQKRQIKFVWELPTETKVFKEGEPAKPFVVSGKYTFSFHKKSKLLPLIESWLGKKIDPSFPLPELLGKTCLLSVANQTTPDGKAYAKVMSVSPLMKGMDCPAQISPTVWWFMDSAKLDEETFGLLTKWERESIQKSPEFMASDLFKKDEFLEMLK